MTVINMSNVVIGRNVRTFPGIEDLASAELSDLPTDEQNEIKMLAENIKMRGLLQPIVVRDLKHSQYRLIAGWRRLMAFKHLNKMRIDAKILKCKKDEESEVQLIENIHRKGLNPMDVARSLDEIRQRKGFTKQASLAKCVNKSVAWVSHHLSLLNADPELQEAVVSGEIGSGGAKMIASLPRAEQKIALDSARKEAVAAGDVTKEGKPKIKTKGARRQSRRQKQAKAKRQQFIRPVAEREQEQKEEVCMRFFEAKYGQKGVPIAHKNLVIEFWDFLMAEHRIVIKP